MDFSNPDAFYLSDDSAGNLFLWDTPICRKEKCSRILVIGSGVAGLTTAWVLLDAGYAVTIIAETWVPITSYISPNAVAIWEWPAAVGGNHTHAVSLADSKRRCMTSYRIFDTIACLSPHGSHGIRMRMPNFFFDKPIQDMPHELLRMQEIEEAEFPGFRHDAAIITSHNVDQEAVVVDTYQYIAPVSNTDG